MHIYLLALLSAFAIQADWLEFKDTKNNYTMQYPATWTVGDEQGTLMFKSEKLGEDDPFQENVNLLLQDLSQQPMTLTEFTQLSMDQYEEMKETVQLLSMEDLKFAGYPAKKVVLNMTYYNYPLKLKQIWFIKGTTAYLLTYTALQSSYATYEADATKLIMSFAFIK